MSAVAPLAQPLLRLRANLHRWVSAMEPTDLTIQILQGIRDEIRETRTELSGRLDETNVRLHETRTELSRRIVESEIRTATAITD